MRRAGATRVVSPYLIGGKRMAQVLLRPTAADFIVIAMMGNDLGLQMEEAVIPPGSPLIGKNLIEATSGGISASSSCSSKKRAAG